VYCFLSQTKKAQNFIILAHNGLRYLNTTLSLAILSFISMLPGLFNNENPVFNSAHC